MQTPPSQPADAGIPREHFPFITAAVLAIAFLATVREFVTYGAAPTAQELVDAGGMIKSYVDDGEWWRIVTSNFLHGDVVHLISNVLVLGIMGLAIENYLGSLRTFLIVAVSCVTTSLGAAIVDPNVVSVGASGIAFAFVGAAVASDTKGNHGVGTLGWQLLVVNVILTFTVANISIGGHLGGLVAGLVIGYVSSGPIRRQWEAARRAEDQALDPDDAARPELPAPTADEILRTAAATGERRVLKPSPLQGALKGSLLLLVSGAFTAGGIWMISGGESSGWFVAGFFGLCTLVAIAMLWPSASRLELTSDGFVETRLFRKWAVRWTDVLRGFVPVDTSTGYTTQKQVGFDVDLTAEQRAKAAHRLSRNLTGVDRVLADTYGLEREELVTLMNEWWERCAPDRARTAGEPGESDRAGAPGEPPTSSSSPQ